MSVCLYVCIPVCFYFSMSVSRYVCMVECWGGGGQPDSDMKVDFAEIGIGKIGISDFFNPKLPILANFGKIGNKIFLEFPIFYSISATFIGVFVPILAKNKKGPLILFV